MRVQIYNSLSRFLIKSEDFLLENEVVNNLFWEVLVESKKKKKVNQWAGNVMKEGKIEETKLDFHFDVFLTTALCKIK